MNSTSAANEPQEVLSWRRRAFEGLFLLAVLALPIHHGGVYFWSFSLAAAVLALGCLLYRPAQPWGRYGLDLRLYLFFAAFALSCLFTQLPYRVPIELYKLGAVCLGYFAVVDYCRDKQHLAVRLCTILAFWGTALSLAGLLQYADGLPNSWWHKRYFLSSVYVNHNHFAGLIEILLPLTLGAAVSEKSQAKKALLGYCAAVMTSAFALSLSRGGMVALSLAMAVFVTALAFLGLFRRAWWLFFVFVLASIAALVVFGIEPIIERFNSFQHVLQKEESFNRAWFWRGALSIVFRFPFTGSGPGTFAEAFLPHRPAGYLGRPVHAHNDYLELLADCGVLTFAAVLFVVGWIVWKAVRSVRSLKDPRQSGVVIGALAALTALAIHSFLDFNFHIPANWFYAGIAAGLLTAVTDTPKMPLRPRWEMAHRGLRMLLAAAVLTGAGWLGSADYFLWHGKRALGAENWPLAEKSFSRSLAIRSFDAGAYYARGLARSGQVRSGGLSKSEHSVLMTGAASDFEEASRLNPHEPFYAYEMIRAKLAVSSKPDQAKVLKAVERMIAMDPRDARVRYLAGKILMSPRVNLLPRSLEEFGHALRIDPKDQVVPVFSVLWDRHLNPEDFQAFVEAVPDGNRHILRFLEKTGRWAHYRRPFLKAEGIDPDALDARVAREAARTDGKVEADLMLSQFAPSDEREVFKGTLFFRRGEVHAPIHTRSGNILIKLKARSVFVHRAFALLVIRWDGRVVDAVYVNRNRYQEFMTAIETLPGEHRLSLAYINDSAPAGSGDRNVWIESVTVVGAP